ncbi:MAG: hypothetical protein GX760_04165 [Erysipelothrix sp.]|nr:hypothetical protein [Erysipelothrix sp.]
MRETMKEIIDSQSSAVIMNVKEDVLNDVIDFIKSYDYKYYVLNSEGVHGTVRLGFINGINEYTGSEKFVKNRVFQELNLINKLYKVGLDNYYLEYIVEWVHWIYTMSTPLNYLDNDGVLFDYLIEFFENKYYEDENTEDEIAIKFLRVLEEILAADTDLPILWIRDRLFKQPAILIVVEDNQVKETYVEALVKQYYDEYVEIEGSSKPLLFVRLQN